MAAKHANGTAASPKRRTTGRAEGPVFGPETTISLLDRSLRIVARRRNRTSEETVHLDTAVQHRERTDGVPALGLPAPRPGQSAFEGRRLHPARHRRRHEPGRPLVGPDRGGGGQSRGQGLLPWHRSRPQHEERAHHLVRRLGALFHHQHLRHLDQHVGGPAGADHDAHPRRHRVLPFRLVPPIDRAPRASPTAPHDEQRGDRRCRREPVVGPPIAHDGRRALGRGPRRRSRGRHLASSPSASCSCRYCGPSTSAAVRPAAMSPSSPEPWPPG